MMNHDRPIWGPVRRWRFVAAVAMVFASGLMIGAGAVAVSSDRALAQAERQCAIEVGAMRSALVHEQGINEGRFTQLKEKAEEHERELQRLMDFVERIVGSAEPTTEPP